MCTAPASSPPQRCPPAGALLSAADLKPGTVNLSASPSAALAAADLAIGRMLARPLSPGDTLRDADLRARQWFAAGDNVRIVAGGSGWRIHGEGQALNPGLEGQAVRVRTESGRIVSGVAAGDRMVEVPRLPTLVSTRLVALIPPPAWVKPPGSFESNVSVPVALMP